MKLISLGSSSDGNCHILYTNGVGIMLDCGANVKNINAVIKDYNIKHILLTHKHQDHISSILGNKISDKGQFIYGNEDVIDKIKDTKYINKVTLEKNKKYVLDANLNGGKRAFVVTGLYDKYLPMDIYPLYLLKAILAGDIDKMENLGIYEVIDEDLALCEFVDPSKNDIQAIVRQGIDLMIKELN